MKIHIRKADISQLDVIIEWRIKVLKEVFFLPDDYDMTLLYNESRCYYKKNLLNEMHTTVFAYNGNNIIGCGSICYQNELPSPDNLNGKCGYLMNIYTIPEYRKKGVGKKIVEFLTQDARSRNICKLSLESSSLGEKLYLSTGFKKNSSFYIKYLNEA